MSKDNSVRIFGMSKMLICRNMSNGVETSLIELTANASDLRGT